MGHGGKCDGGRQSIPGHLLHSEDNQSQQDVCETTFPTTLTVELPVPEALTQPNTLRPADASL